MLISGAGGGGFTQALLQGKQLGNQARALREQAHQRRQQLALGIGGLGLGALNLGGDIYGTVAGLSEAEARRKQSGDQFAQNLGQRKLEFEQGIGQQESEFARRLSEIAAGREQAAQQFAQTIAQRGKEFETELPLRYPTVPGPNGPQQLSVAEALSRMAEPEKHRTWASTEAEKGRTYTETEAEKDRAFRESLASMGQGFALDQLRTADELKRGAEAETYARGLSPAAREQAALELENALKLEQERAKSKPSELGAALLPEQIQRRTKVGDWAYSGAMEPNTAKLLAERIVGPEGQAGMLPEERTYNYLQDIATKKGLPDIGPSNWAKMSDRDFRDAMYMALMEQPPAARQSVFREIMRLRAMGGGRAPAMPLVGGANPEFLEALRTAIRQR